MVKLHYVKKARKDYPEAGIKKGEPYYWWKFRFSGIRRSKFRPRRSQLTQSEFLAQVYDIEDTIADLNTVSSFEELSEAVVDIVEEIRRLAEEQQDKLDNMPDSLQYGPTGELLENRIRACEEWADDIEYVELDPNVDRHDYISNRDYREAIRDALDEAIEQIQSCEYLGE